MKAVEFIYQDTQIHFALNNSKNVMVNATEMANVFNKRVDVFLKTDHAKAFIKVLLSTPNGVDKTTLTMDEILVANKKAGTYMHRILALKFAAWLDPSFEVWVYTTIEEVLFGSYKKHSQAVLNKLTAEEELIEITALLLENPEFEKYLKIQEYIKTSDVDKQRALREQINQMKMDFRDK